MSKIKKIITIPTVLIIIGWMGFEIIREILRLYGTANDDVKLGLITAVGTALAFVINNAIQSSRERKAKLFENKREAYDQFFDFFFSIFRQQKAGKPLNEDEIQEKFTIFTQDVMTWGSAETINAVLEYQRSSLNIDTNRINTLFASTEKLLLALRKDLGHSDSTLEKSALTKLILKPEEHSKLN